MKKYENFEKRLQEAKRKIEELEDDYQEFTLELEEDIIEELEAIGPFDKEGNKVLRNFLREIKNLKEENEFYDEEAELDLMFPNRHDDDFDEDSMSYDSVFGDD